MTEEEWLASEDTLAMVWSLRDRVSERKLRLFAASVFRRLSRLLPDSCQQQAVAVLEQIAEGTATAQARRSAGRDARHAIPPDGPDAAGDLHYAALMLYREFASSSLAVHAAHAGAAASFGDFAEGEAHCHALREVVGNPFRPVILDTEWLTPTVTSLAEATYQERILPAGELDPPRLAVLSDALEEAGCTDAALLEHLRSPGPHVRGCWALDLVLSKA